MSETSAALVAFALACKAFCTLMDDARPAMEELICLDIPSMEEDSSPILRDCSSAV